MHLALPSCHSFTHSGYRQQSPEEPTVSSLADTQSQYNNARFPTHLTHIPSGADNQSRPKFTHKRRHTRPSCESIAYKETVGGSHCEFHDTATRYRHSSWPTATTCQHRTFRAANEQRDISKTKEAETHRKFDLSEYLILTPGMSSFIFASFNRATDLCFELQPTFSPPCESGVCIYIYTYILLKDTKQTAFLVGQRTD